MTASVLEMDHPQRGWVECARLEQGDAPGMMVSEPPSVALGNKEVYVWGWLGPNGPAVWHTKNGREITALTVRDIERLNMDQLADLLTTQFEFDWWRYGMAHSMRLRFEP